MWQGKEIGFTKNTFLPWKNTFSERRKKCLLLSIFWIRVLITYLVFFREKVVLLMMIFFKTNFGVFVLLTSKQSYSDAFTEKKINFKLKILSVQKHLILEIPFVWKKHGKKRWKSHNPWPIGKEFKNASNTRAKYCDKC